MSKWTWIIISIVVLFLLSYLTLLGVCRTIENNVIYKNPMVKYNRTLRENRTVVLLNKTDVHFDKADGFKLMPDGQLIVDNPVHIVFSNTTNSTIKSGSETIENGSSKPLLDPFKDPLYAIVGLNLGFNVLFDPHIVVNQIPQVNIENWTIGLFTDITGNRIWINYTHINAFPDTLCIGTSFKVF